MKRLFFVFLWVGLALPSIAQAELKVDTFNSKIYKYVKVTDKNFYAKASATVIPKTWVTKPSIALAGKLMVGDRRNHVNVDASVKFSYPPPKINTTLNLDIAFEGYQYNYWEQFELMADYDGIEISYSEDFDLKKDDVQIAAVSWNVGCMFRDSPNGNPIARANAGTKFIVVNDGKDYKGWAHVMLKNNEGWVDGYVNKRLMTALNNGESTPAFNEKKKLY